MFPWGSSQGNTFGLTGFVATSTWLVLDAMAGRVAGRIVGVGESDNSECPAAGTATPTEHWTAVMERALDVARAAALRGEVPIGAVVVDPHGEVLAMAGNDREGANDPTGHAEIIALRAAAAAAGSWRLEGCTLVVTLEPCLMCAGAALAARVGRIVFGASSSDNGAVGSLYNLAVDPRLGAACEVVGGVLSERCTAELQGFFHRLR